MIGSTIRSAKMKAITPANADAAAPEDGGERYVADGADEAEHRDDRPDERAPDRLNGRRGVRQEEAVEEVVAEQCDEAGQQEADGDLPAQHLPVAAEVVRRRRTRRGARGAAKLGARGLVCGRATGRAPVPPARAVGTRTAAAWPTIRTIITTPPTYSASVNCQPISTQRTSPSSQTRLVEANWKASAEVAADAPFWKRLFAIAIAA